MATATEKHAYRAICSHGKVRGLCGDPNEMDNEFCAKDMRKAMREFINYGLTLERVTVEEARKSDMDCPECEAARARKRTRKSSSRDLFEAGE